MELLQSTNDNPRFAPDWPIKAISEDQVTQIFDKMYLLYGSRWSSMWAGPDPEKLKRYWALKLGEISKDAIQAGYNALDTVLQPPSLPEFIMLCRNNRPLDEHTLALEAPKSRNSRSNAEKMLQDLSAAGVIKETDIKTDHKLWAKRIIKRLKEGDKRLSMIQIKFAKEALNIED